MSKPEDAPPIFTEPFVMQPVKTSLFDTEIKKGIDQDDFVIIDGRVMLPQEAVAEFFEMSVEQLMRAVQYVQQTWGLANDVVWRNGRYYFPSGESMSAIHFVSIYREAEFEPTFFDRVFVETQRDLVTDCITRRYRSRRDSGFRHGSLHSC